MVKEKGSKEGGLLRQEGRKERLEGRRGRKQEGGKAKARQGRIVR